MRRGSGGCVVRVWRLHEVFGTVVWRIVISLNTAQ
jgi:hypothetical protein